MPKYDVVLTLTFRIVADCDDEANDRAETLAEGVVAAYGDEHQPWDWGILSVVYQTDSPISKKQFCSICKQSFGSPKEFIDHRFLVHQ